MRKVLSKEKITLTEKELDNFLSKVSDNLLKEVDNNYNGFVKQVIQGDTVFSRTEEGVKKQLEIVAKDINNIPSEHLQHFLANLFLNKDAKTINESVTDGNISIITNKEINLDDESNKYLYSLYEQIPNNFAEERQKLDNLIIEELGKNEFLTDLITDGGEITPQDFREAYEEAPQMTIDRIYNLDISDMDIKDIEDILLEIQKVREKYFETNTGIKYQKSDLVFVEHLSGNGHTQVAFHDPKTNTIYVSQDKVTTLGKLIDVFLHETQHNEQDLISIDTSSDKVSQEIKELYAINGQGYINPEKDNLGLLDRLMYQGQLLEKEAYGIMRGEEIIKSLVESYIKKENEKYPFETETLTQLTNENRVELEMYQPDDEKPDTSTNKTSVVTKELSADDIINSPDFHYSVNKMIESLTQKYGDQSAKVISEELNLNNPLIKERLKIDLENEMAQIKVPITDEVLSLFLNEMVLKYVKLQKEKPEEYKLMNGFGGKVFVRTEDGMRKQLEIVAKNRDKIPPEHLQEFLANLFTNKEAKKIEKEGIEGKIMVANDLRLDKTYIDDINLSAIQEMIPNKFSDTRKEIDNLIVAELGDNEYLKSFVTNGGRISKEILKEAFLKNPDLLINTIYSVDARNLSNEDIKLLLNEIDKARGKYFEEKTGLSYIPNKIEFVQNSEIKGQIANHNLNTGTITIYKNSITTLGYLIDTLLHESQHHEQGIISLSEQKGKISEQTKELYDLGHFTYIDGKKPTEHSLTMYKSQLVEKEAFNIMRTKEILKNVVENIIK